MSSNDLSYSENAAAFESRRYFYGATLPQFLTADENSIIGRLAARLNSVTQLDIEAWRQQIRILKETFAGWSSQDDRIFFEFVVPRLGKRIDNVVVIDNILFVIEFKTGESDFSKYAVDQVWDYALDLLNFHSTSHDAAIVPILVATNGESQQIRIYGTSHGDNLTRPVRAAPTQLLDVILESRKHFKDDRHNLDAWELGRYSPTPTIVEAAKALYAGHGVEDISRSDAGAINLQITSNTVNQIILDAREKNRKAIIFITGVPGAGKTLVGLDVATKNSDAESKQHSVFLSGNGPLVAVLTEALAVDKVTRAKESGERLLKGQAKSAVKAFIQIVHHFRDEGLVDKGPPADHVALFDEAQRAWNRSQTSTFRKTKKGIHDFDMSEPEFLISCMDRHDDWAVVVCLIGEGQEINKGEGGVSEWTTAIRQSFPHWDVHISPNILNDENDARLRSDLKYLQERIFADESLHLSTSMRSFRAENLSNFVKLVLDLELDAARAQLKQIRANYPIVLTRDLDAAKQWVKEQARGTERYGMVVSSKAQRLKPLAIDVRPQIDPVHWFLHPGDDVRSSNFLEDAATEFVVQGLELDWACVVWDGDLRIDNGKWSHHEFKGTKWQRVNAEERRRYQLNAYRVLLTRARQGMVIVIPEGSMDDISRHPDKYDGAYRMLKSLGMSEI